MKSEFICSPQAELDPDGKWIVHNADEFCVGEFDCEKDARTAVDLWSRTDARRIKVEWAAPDEDADDSDRGIYTVRMIGSAWKATFSEAWHAMDAQIDCTQQMMNVLAKYGFDTVDEILFASQDLLTKHGWNVSRFNQASIPPPV